MPEPSYTTTPPQDVAGATLTGGLTADTTGPPVSGGSGKPRSLWSDAWHDLRRNPMFVVSALLIMFLIVVAAFPGLITSTDPKFCELVNSNGGATPGHPFGFDRQGCDIFSRVIFGARASVTVGILVTTGVVLIGGLIGAIAAFYGGAADSVLSRLADVFFAIPLLLGAIVFLGAFPSRNVWIVVTAIIVLGWPQVSRIMRGSVISVKESDFVTAARALGASDLRILVRHILPNAIAPVIVIATISLGQFIVLEATLSFFGIGLPGSTVSWGGDINDAQASLQVAPHVLLYPSVALSITVLAFMLLGDAVRDALDPKLR
jgi:oligopeptide transport system permease protein